MQSIRTNAPDIGALSPFEAALVANGDHTISEAMLQRTIARIRCHQESDIRAYCKTFFQIDPSPEIIADLLSWE